MIAFLVSAAHKSSGKTTIATGLGASLRGRGQTVQTFKKGPDYIDPMWLGRASGRHCRNLDFWTQDEAEIAAHFQSFAAAADVAIVEGSKGLYDGIDPAGGDSTAALARLLGLPVILVIDCQGITRGVAPLILGYQAFEPDLRIAGVILNKVGGERHEGKLHAAVNHHTDVPVLGAVHRNRDLEIVERHIGLVPTNEAEGPDDRIETIAEHVADHVDIDLLLRRAGDVEIPAVPAAPAAPASDVRLAVARDAAFGFYYPGDLEALQAAGAEIVAFDSLSDPVLPDCDGLFISGGFPETQMAALEANESLRQSIRAALAGGLPAYAECGGLMYLARSIAWQGETRQMVGAVPADVVMTPRPVGRGYVRLRETGAGPWPQVPISGKADESLPAHEFHYSRLENLDSEIPFAYQVLRGHGIDGQYDGLVVGNLLASYAHLRQVAGNRWADRFVDFVRRSR
ncbi:MAG TPA: cobyrinate a,c-diamide synthase [Alphaproteobacteria bacterium]|jgi:cobyrinic acid a,c-diamide synthase|nr:cobyrinate a,c-diamide synthase [Alphaproteobacteria bacterium]